MKEHEEEEGGGDEGAKIKTTKNILCKQKRRGKPIGDLRRPAPWAVHGPRPTIFVTRIARQEQAPEHHQLLARRLGLKQCLCLHDHQDAHERRQCKHLMLPGVMMMFHLDALTRIALRPFNKSESGMRTQTILKRKPPSNHSPKKNEKAKGEHIELEVAHGLREQHERPEKPNYLVAQNPISTEMHR